MGKGYGGKDPNDPNFDWVARATGKPKPTPKPEPKPEHDEPDEGPDSAASDPDEGEPASESDADADDEPDDDDEGGSESSSSGRSWRAPSAPAAVNTGAGWVLGLLLWGWVILPFVKGGPTGVKNTFLAKFLNKAPDGSRLP